MEVMTACYEILAGCFLLLGVVFSTSGHLLTGFSQACSWAITSSILSGGTDMKINRRDLLCGAPFAAGAALLGRATGWPGAELFAQNVGLASLPAPEHSGIEHIVVVMMENRSFDHLLGWLPGANGRQAGLQFRGPDGALHRTFALAPTIGFSGCNNLDPDHSWDGGRTQVNGGKMDGW